jgi:hypothetical protein
MLPLPLQVLGRFRGLEGSPEWNKNSFEGSVTFLGTARARAGGIVGVEVLCGSKVGQKKASSSVTSTTRAAL